MDDDGCQQLVDADILLAEKTVSTYTVNGNVDPLTAKASIQHDLKIAFQEANVNADISTDSLMTCDLDNFYLTDSLTVKLNGEDFFSKTWKNKASRRFV